MLAMVWNASYGMERYYGTTDSRPFVRMMMSYLLHLLLAKNRRDRKKELPLAASLERAINTRQRSRVAKSIRTDHHANERDTTTSEGILQYYSIPVVLCC